MSSVEQQLARGWQVHQTRSYQQAEAIYRRVLEQVPHSANAWCYLGIVLHDQRRYQSAVDAYRTALKLNPEFPIALNNLGNSLRYTGEFEEADRQFQAAIDLKPDYLNAYKNRGTLHVWTGHLNTGLQYYQQALRLNPNEAELHRNLGVIYLLQGRFREGWDEYRWRWQVGDLHRPFSNIPVWEGQAVAGKSLVLTAEQGLGDTLHFVRFAKILQSAGAQTIVYCQPAILGLLQTADLGPVVPNNMPLDTPVHYQCSLLDVADRLHIDAQTIPYSGPYLHPAANLGTYWSHRLPKPAGKLRVGIAWQGNPDHQADIFRSVPLQAFEPLAEQPHVELVALQQGFGVEQMDSWQGRTPLLKLGSEIDKSSGAFMDTAAIMRECLDLVITSDTSIAHLAGALGIPTWLLLGFIPDWRWLLDRDDTPWYPSIRLFRQSAMGDWSSVFDQVDRALQLEIEQCGGKS